MTMHDEDTNNAIALEPGVSDAGAPSRRASGRLREKPDDDQDAAEYVPSPQKSRSLRQRATKSSYAEEEDDDDDDGDGDGDSDNGNDDDGDEEHVSHNGDREPADSPPPERKTSAGHSLRPRASLVAPTGLRDYISTDRALARGKKPRKKGPSLNSKAAARTQTLRRTPVHATACAACRDVRQRCDRGKPICGRCTQSGKTCVYKGKTEGEEADDDFGEVLEKDFGPKNPTIRGQIRKGIEETTRKREAFLVKYRELFEPLLPEKNYVTKLSDKNISTDQVAPYKQLEKQPEHVKATMKPYQLGGLSFLVWMYKNGANAILGDEMGLGKTLQTLSLFSYLTTYEPSPDGHARPFLVVCPLSVLSSWVSECRKWTPHLRVLRFHGPQAERDRMKRLAESGEFNDIVVTSYEVFEREKAWFRRAFVWRYVVLDEGHKIKNEKTNISLALQGLAAEYRLILTGTPLQNNLTELWALLHWLYPEVFHINTSRKFSDAFDLTLGKNDLKVMDSARSLLELIMLRRMKESKGVNLGLPKKTEVVLFLPLVPMQRFWYKRLLTRLDKSMLEDVFKAAKEKAKVEDLKIEDLKPEDLKIEVTKLEDLENEPDVEVADKSLWGETRQIVQQALEQKNDGKWRKLMNLLMQLRKCCNHPYLLPQAEPQPPVNGPHVILASAKFILLNKLIDELCIKQGRKVLIFSGFTRMLDVCEDLMALKGGDGSIFKYGRLDGTTARARRNLAIRLFNGNPEYKIMLISTRAGGLGINLASASDVVMLESDWNPQADLQAQARAHRIGQVQEVTVYRLVTQGTVEEQMMGRIRKKLYLSAKVTESMRDIHTSTSNPEQGDAESETAMPHLTTGQLMSLVRSGSRAIARPEIDPTEMLQWDWETMIQKCRDYQVKLESDETATADSEEEEKKWLSEMERVETRVFEGKTHVKAIANKDVAQEWSRESRRLGMERVVMINGHPVLKETVGNNEWEAVKTFAGKDPRLAEPPKRKRKTIEHQDFCQVCYDGGDVHVCSGCPRVYHFECLTQVYQEKSKGGQFHCPQHQCFECEQKTTNAGGMLFRCRWCENAFCEDCLDFEGIQLLGESLPEYEILGFEAVQQAFYIKCHNCIGLHAIDKESEGLCLQMETEWIAELEKIEALQPEPEEIPTAITINGDDSDDREEEKALGIRAAKKLALKANAMAAAAARNKKQDSSQKRKREKRDDDDDGGEKQQQKQQKLKNGVQEIKAEDQQDQYQDEDDGIEEGLNLGSSSKKRSRIMKLGSDNPAAITTSARRTEIIEID